MLDEDKREQVMRGENVQTDNLELWLDFEHVSGTTMYDLSGNGLNGTVSGATTNGTFLADCITCGSGSYHGDFKGTGEPKIVGTEGAKFGGNKALWFDGTDDYITHATYLDVVPTAINFAFWINFDATFDSGSAVRMATFAKRNVTNDDECWAQFEDGSGLFRFSTEEGGNGRKNLFTNQASWMGGVWYHIVCTWDTTNGKRIFVNGALDNSDATATTLMGNGTQTDFFFGVQFDGSSDPFGGKIAEFITYHEVLSTADVMDLFKGNYSDAVLWSYIGTLNKFRELLVTINQEIM